jgi:hypothetical protein
MTTFHGSKRPWSTTITAIAKRQLNMPLKRQKSGWTGRETKKKGERKTGQDNCREPDKVIDI